MKTGGCLAIKGGAPAVTVPAPTWPIVGEQEQAWMAEVVRSGKWSWLGEHERAFCEEYSRFIGTNYCACMANGTVTIQCALQAVGVKPGDEVIVPALTWVATAQAALDIGANVVIVDIDPETLCISPTSLASAITPKTRAIIPVHLYGCMCDMDAVLSIAREHGLKVVEDVAHQHGSEWRGVKAGALGDAGSFSFQQSKVLPCGEGGAVTCDDAQVYETAFALKQVGWKPSDIQASHFDNLVPGNRYGHNYRMTEMQAVLLRGGLSRLSDQTRIREENASYIGERLSVMGGPLRAAKRDERVTCQAYYAMTLHYDSAMADGLDKVSYAEALCAEGYAIGGLYAPVYRNELLNFHDSTSPVPYRAAGSLQDYANMALPNVERACRETGLVMNQVFLLGDRTYIDQLLVAVSKVNDNLAVVREASEPHPG